MRKLLRYNLWFEHDVVQIKGERYLERWFIYLLGFTIRVHKFYRGDDDRAPHDHPWGFITFPLTGYWEAKYDDCRYQCKDVQYVKPWRFHRRPSSYRHIVLGAVRNRGVDQYGREIWCEYLTPVPFWTIVVTGRKDRSWGFYPNGNYIYYRDFK